MTRAEFESLMLEYTKTEAQPFVNSGAGLHTLVSDAIREFCAYSYCLFDDNVALTVPSARVIDLRGVLLASEVICPVSVALGGTQLRNFEDRIGPCTLQEVTSNRSETAGVASRWAFKLPNHIVFERSLSGVTGSSWVAGFTMHPVLEDDGDVVALPDDWLRPAIVWAASRLIDPRAGGTSLDKMRSLDERAATAAVFLARVAVQEYPWARPMILQEAG